MKRQTSSQWAAMAVVFAVILSLSVLHLSGAGGCGGGGGGGGGGEVEDNVSSANAISDVINVAAQSLTSSVSDLMDQEVGLKVSAPKATVVTAQGGGDFSCTVIAWDETDCLCPGGGSFTIRNDLGYSALGECGHAGIFANSWSGGGARNTSYSGCIMEVCGEQVTLNGETYEDWTLTHDCDGSGFSEAVFVTTETCSGMTVAVAGGVGSNDIGFRINVTGSGSGVPWDYAIDGTFCIDPHGSSLGEETSFDSWEDLVEALDPSGSCNAAEEAAEEEEEELTCEEDPTLDSDADGVVCGDDCDDTDATITEVEADADADGITTCDGDCDDADSANTDTLADADGDGTTTCDGDCDDADSTDTSEACGGGDGGDGDVGGCTTDQECKDYSTADGAPADYVAATTCVVASGTCQTDCNAVTSTTADACVTHLTTDEGMTCTLKICSFTLP